MRPIAAREGLRKTDKIKSLMKKVLNRETILYLVFGVLTTVISYTVGLLCYSNLPIEADPVKNLTSNVISWIVSVTFAFVTNKLFVFESKSWAPKVFLYELVTFYSARLLSLGVEVLGMWLLVDVMTYSISHDTMYAIAKLIMNVLVIIINYVLSKLVIFRKKGAKSQGK